MWTMNFQLFRLVLEKAEEPENKLPTSIRSWKKQESSRKASTSALLGVPGGSEVKASACNARDLGSIPGSGRFPGKGNGYPLQYSCMENSISRGAWWATVDYSPGVAKSWTWLTDFHSHGNISCKEWKNKGKKWQGSNRTEEIKKRWQEYTEELYIKGLNDPDNHRGSVT